MNTSQICQDDTQRRRAVRAHRDGQGNPDLNGIDYIEVSEHDQRILNVHFMDKAPEDITVKNVRIDGGRRIRNIKVTKVELCAPDDPEQADCMQITVDRAGDFSTYTLCLVKVDDQGHPTGEPLDGFDVRYTCIDFSFKANCPSDLDCQPVDICPPRVLVEPEISYLAKDYQSLRQLILDRLALIMPDWQERHVPDIGITLVEILAYVGDYLSYYQDAVATEAYLGTARQRISVRRHTRLVDYRMHEGCNARAWLFVETLTETNAAVPLNPQDVYFITGQNDALPVSSTMLTDVDLQGIPSSDYEVFEPLLEDPQQPIQLYAAHDEIHFYTWGEQECCLPRGATSATLDDSVPVTEPGPGEQTPEQQESTNGASGSASQYSSPKQEQPAEPERKLHLKVGDVLIFEEVLGPKTGNPADADPTHRHVVRLTMVELAVDALYNIPVVEIAWSEEDRLPFPLCLSTIGPPYAFGSPPQEPCTLLTNISVARGNVILVDYGKTVLENLEPVPVETTIPKCEGEGILGETEIVAGVFHPVLQKAPLTFYQLLPADAPFFQLAVPDPDKAVALTSAYRLLLQDPRQAVPWIRLTGTPPPDGGVLHTSAEDQDKDEDENEETEVEGEGAGQHVSTDIAWVVQRDLLESEADDYHFVVEMDNDGFAHLRFGDGELGRKPEAGTVFHAQYRVGNGLPGNVGAETITHIVFHKDRLSGATLKPSNPFAASGSTDPEPLAEVRLFASHAFRTNLQRAITADDYARLAERNPKVQRAAATLRWTGSWYEALVAIDPFGSEEADDALLQEIAAYLERYRRMGYDLKAVSAHYIPLDIAMTICVEPHFLRGHVKAALLELFSNRVLPDGRLGFFHPDNLTFGEGIALSKLVATAQAVPGVQSVTVDRLQRFGELANNELENEFLPIGPAEIAQLDNDPSFPEHGKLVFKMEGGR